MDNTTVITAAIANGVLSREEETLGRTLLAKHGVGVFRELLKCREREQIKAQEAVYRQLGVSAEFVQRYSH
ncbi:MAG: hypothetical protein ACRERD_33185 [Candidatus Binatia bacterium]